LERLDISITVLYKGELPTGTANVYADIDNPDGYSHKLFGQTGILSMGESQTITFKQQMLTDGDYSVDVKLSPPEKPYLDHVFDHENTAFIINPNGLERTMHSVGDYSTEVISYWLQNYKDVKYNEIVHAVIALPEHHTFEKIAVVNGKFVREMSIDTEDIYIDSVAPFKDLKVKLVKEGNLLPLADAQDTMQEYVKFYSNDKELCTKVFCVNIDSSNEPPVILLVMIAIVVIAVVILVLIGVILFVLKTRPAPYSNILGKQTEWDKPYVNKK